MNPGMALQAGRGSVEEGHALVGNCKLWLRQSIQAWRCEQKWKGARHSGGGCPPASAPPKQHPRAAGMRTCARQTCGPRSWLWKSCRCRPRQRAGCTAGRQAGRRAGRQGRGPSALPLASITPRHGAPLCAHRHAPAGAAAATQGTHQLRLVQLLHRGKEGVHVDVQPGAGQVPPHFQLSKAGVHAGGVAWRGQGGGAYAGRRCGCQQAGEEVARGRHGRHGAEARHASSATGRHATESANACSTKT